MKTKRGFVGFIIILVMVLCCCCMLSSFGIINIGRTTAFLVDDPQRDLHIYLNK